MIDNVSSTLVQKIDVFKKIELDENFTSDEKILLRDQTIKDQIIGLYAKWEKK